MKAGDTTTLTLQVDIKDDWYIYGIKEYINKEGVGPTSTEITISSKEITVLTKKITTTKPTVVFDSSFEITIEKFKHHAEFKLPITCSKTLKAGVYTFDVIAYYQACTGANCLRAVEAKVPVKVTVTDADKGVLQVASPDSSSTADASTEPSPAQPQQPEQAAKPQTAAVEQVTTGSPAEDAPTSIWSLIWIAVGLGVGSWVMPCVYPMIPITVSFFTKRSEKEKTAPIMDSLVYSLGIMSTFIVFGVVVALVFKSAGAGKEIATNPWLNLFLSVLFLVIAGNLFGMYEIALPAGFVNSLNKKSHESKGYSASFLMGMVFSLTSFTCTVPFVDLVGKMAAGGEAFRPIFAMTVYSAVFALPFFLLALFPKVMTKLPRSGAWMNNIKVVFGFVEIAFAVSYFARVDSLLTWEIIPREIVLAIWAGCALLTTLYIIGAFRMKLDSPLEHLGGVRALFAVGFATLTFYIFSGISGNSVGPLEPFVYVESSSPSLSELIQEAKLASTATTNSGYTPGTWIDDLSEAQRIAKDKNLTVFVDFTGVSCTNCRWMEKNMFPKQRVKSLMNEMVLVRAYTDRRTNPMDEKYRIMQEGRFNSTLLPLYVLLTPDDKFIASSTYTPSEDEFVTFLQKAKQQRMAVSELPAFH